MLLRVKWLRIDAFFASVLSMSSRSGRIETKCDLFDVLCLCAADAAQAAQVSSVLTGASTTDRWPIIRIVEMQSHGYEKDREPAPPKAREPLCQGRWDRMATRAPR